MKTEKDSGRSLREQKRFPWPRSSLTVTTTMQFSSPSMKCSYSMARPTKPLISFDEVICGCSSSEEEEEELEVVAGWTVEGWTIGFGDNVKAECRTMEGGMAWRVGYCFGK
ncbi:hypothetical protein AHAS_Ahas18G0119700 [Arachis hypogaea]